MTKQIDTSELSHTTESGMHYTACYAPCFNHGSLFSGIGGFDLAAKWMNWNNVFQVEIDNYCQKLLTKNFPDVTRYSDIREFDGKQYTGAIDIISGGFPCQPFSNAGQKQGKKDDRYLWPEMLRVIREIQPIAVLGENVPGIVGMELDNMQADLESEGYKTQSFIIPACGKNAKHKRDRVWIIAYSDSQRWKDEQKERTKLIYNRKWNDSTKEQSRNEQQCGIIEPSFILTNTNNAGCKEQRQPIANGTEYFAPKCSSWWETEPGMGRVADGIPNRVDRLKSLGNAIVPQIAFEMFHSIEARILHGA